MFVEVKKFDESESVTHENESVLESNKTKNINDGNVSLSFLCYKIRLQKQKL